MTMFTTSQTKYASNQRKQNTRPHFYEKDGRVFHEISSGVSFSLPKGEKAKAYKRKVEEDYLKGRSKRSTSPKDHPAVSLGKSVSRKLDARDRNRPRYASLKDFILRRPDTRYKPSKQKLASKNQNSKSEKEQALTEATRKGGISGWLTGLTTQVSKRGKKVLPLTVLSGMGGAVSGGVLKTAKTRSSAQQKKELVKHRLLERRKD